jgi:hypothetical protein
MIASAEVRIGDVSGLLLQPEDARLLYVLAHGAGAGMRHPFLEALARGLAERGVGTLRYEFPYMERRARRPDPPGVATATVRAAVAEATRLAPGLPLVAGGKSFGGRMTSTAQASEPLPGVRGLVFLGFPLHPPGRPDDTRARHLDAVRIPMLFLQGDRDEFAELRLLRPVVKGLGTRATLHLVEGGDHSFKVLKRSGRTDGDVMGELVEAIVEWSTALAWGGEMPNHWIVKTEPSTYSYNDLARQKTAVWDGVKNNLALKHLRQMKPGDEVLVYHTGDEKAVVGLARVESEPYPDPKQKDPKLAVVDLRAVGRLPRPVPLSEIKEDRSFTDLGLVRMGRLSVMPASAEQFKRLAKLGGMK